MTAHGPRGHLYVIDGDLQGIAVDAWLLPTDAAFSITRTWEDTKARISPKELSRVSKEGWAGRTTVFLETIDDADVWLGNVGLGRIGDAELGLAVTHWVECARSFIRESCAMLAKTRPDRIEHRLPIVAINHLATGRGGARRRHGHVLKSLITELTTDLNNGSLNADVVLVAWGEQPESASQYFRSVRSADWRKDLQWSFGPRTTNLHGVAERLAAHLQDDSMSIFLGAGASIGAGLSDWSGVLTTIGKRAGVLDKSDDLARLGDLRDQASLLDKRIRAHPPEESTLHTMLSEHLSGAKFSLVHGLVASFPCNEFITTNVDELFEKACRSDGRDITVMPHTAGGKGRWLLKLHGTISEPDKMVFTRENYLDAGRNSRALIGLVQAMLFTRHMLFVGYGLRDEDFHELVYEVRRAYGDTPIQKKIGTVLLLGPDPMKAEIWDDILEIVPVGTGADAAQDARDIARFLDLVGMLAADKYRFFLDEAYNHEGFEHEDDLRSHLTELTRLVDSREGAAATEVRKLLARLGHESGR